MNVLFDEIIDKVVLVIARIVWFLSGVLVGGGLVWVYLNYIVR